MRKNPEGLSGRHGELDPSFLSSRWGQRIPTGRNDKAFSKQHSHSTYLAGKLQKILESQMLSQAKINMMEWEVGRVGQTDGGSTFCIVKQLIKSKLIAWSSNCLIAGCPFFSWLCSLSDTTDKSKRATLI